MPETLLALIMEMWRRELGDIPKNTSNLVVTYFDTIYTNNPIPEDLYIHEMVHYVRQGAGKDESLARTFCIRYCEDKKFRYQEELMAYKEQYKYILQKKKMGRAQAFEVGKYLAKELSSPKYGNICSFNQALTAIVND